MWKPCQGCVPGHLYPTSYALMAVSNICHPVVKAIVSWLERQVREKKTSWVPLQRRKHSGRLWSTASSFQS